MVWQLDDELRFPNPYWGEDDGLVAIGGDLSVDRLLLAYSNGYFPWYAFDMEREPHWYCPLDRFVIFPREIHISHSMRQLIRQQKYEVTFNEDFTGVIQGCSKAQGRDEQIGAWLGPDMIEAYSELHRLGYATSVEVWETVSGLAGRRLVGGLYGVTLGKVLPLGGVPSQPDSKAVTDASRLMGAFFGESMFSLVPNASKLALVSLAKAMEAVGGVFIDCQFETSLFQSMGGRHIPYDEYMKLLVQEAQ